MKMTEKQDDNFDKKNNIKENSKMDATVDTKHGLPAEHAKNAPTLAAKNGPALNTMGGGSKGGSNIITKSSGVDNAHGTPKPGTSSGK